MRSVRVRRLFAVVVVGVALALLARAGWSMREHGLDWGDKAASIAGFVLLAAGTLAAVLRRLLGWTRDAKPLSNADLEQATEDLAVALTRIWANEERLRRINDPWPLPVRWATVDSPSSDTGEPNATSGAGVFTDVAAFFTALATPRLVILGTAGSGKSVLAARLVRDLLAARSAGDPLPVLVPLGNWHTGATLSRWLADELVNLSPALAAQVRAGDHTPVTVAQALVDAARILPVLDGLDELPAPERAWVIEQINAYGSDRPLVMTSRPDEYRGAEHRAGRPIALATAVHLRPLSTDEVCDYLLAATAGARTGRWQAIFNNVTAAPTGAPAQVLTNPLMLWLARTVYEHQSNDPAELLTFSDAHTMEQHLLEALIPAVYGDRPAPTPFRCRPKQARRWLAALAADLARADSRDLAWWRMSDPSRFWASLVVAVRCAIGAALLWGAVALAIALDAPGPGRNLFAEWGRLASSGPIGVHLPPSVTETIDALQGSDLPPEIDVGVMADLRVFASWVAVWAILGTGLVALGRSVEVPPLPSALGRRPVTWRWTLVRLWVGVSLTGLTALGVVRTWYPHLAVPKINGFLLTAAVLGVVMADAPGWLVQPVDVSRAVGPAQLVRLDRRAGLVSMLGRRGTFALLIWLFAGPATLVGYLAYAVARAAVTALIGDFGPASSRFAATRLSYALRRRLPWRFMPFLTDAHRRGVLRQIGAVYQFRHLRLQNHLAEADANGRVQQRLEQLVTWIERHRTAPRRDALVLQRLPWSRQRWRDPTLATKLAARAPAAEHVTDPIDDWSTGWRAAHTWQLGPWRQMAEQGTLLPGEHVRVHLTMHPVAVLPAVTVVAAGIASCLLLFPSLLCLAIGLIITAAVPFFIASSEQVTVTDRRIRVVTMSRRVEVPLRHITDLRYEQSLLGRVLGYGQLKVTTVDVAQDDTTSRRTKHERVGWHNMEATAEGTVIAHLTGLRDVPRAYELIRHLLPPDRASNRPHELPQVGSDTTTRASTERAATQMAAPDANDALHPGKPPLSHQEPQPDE
ncbi:NACHT domain-containing protein [Micromonospora sp. AKA38]|uniref:NACHT domain-containing protein n=1 Tax=Micromonospora sp. AKA38 TaxID=2733861 RepID=UPI0022C295D5|nr:NACHT domain-containing protein [Micromonospora sp. AKA38]GHJ12985.1 hypothetical protein TPA0908_09800 [Micromonospora sp. AKA38]